MLLQVLRTSLGVSPGQKTRIGRPPEQKLNIQLAKSEFSLNLPESKKSVHTFLNFGANMALQSPDPIIDTSSPEGSIKLDVLL
jgi:hypothetical protein